jgi:hypothetical protein
MHEECCNKHQCSSCEDTCHSHKTCSCCCHKNGNGHNHDECDMSDFLIELADCAWSEALKEKMKEYILSTQGDRMAELAKIVAEGNNQRWKHKMEKKQGCSDFKEKLCRFFGQSKK